MYFFSGAAVWTKRIPDFCVTSSSCGIERLAQTIFFTPTGIGVGGRCPPCAHKETTSCEIRNVENNFCKAVRNLCMFSAGPPVAPMKEQKPGALEHVL